MDKFQKCSVKEPPIQSFHCGLRCFGPMMTGIPVFSGAFLVFIFESGNSFTPRGTTVNKVMRHPFSKPVTTRTADFIPWISQASSTPTVIISLLWMFIEDHPWALPVVWKTTTTRLILPLRHIFRHDVEVYGRRIRERAIPPVLPWLLQEPVPILYHDGAFGPQ